MSHHERQITTAEDFPRPSYSAEELSLVQGQLDWAKKVLFRPLGYREPFTSQAPYIIGYVPEDERDAFSTFGQPGVSLQNLLQDKIELIRQRMPNTFALIDEDIRQIDPNLSRLLYTLDRHETKPGQSFRLPARRWHIDYALKYLISNRLPTEYYRGSAQVNENNFGISILDDDTGVPALPFAILRQLPQVVHRSPTPSEPASRTFLEVVATKPRPK